MKLARLQNERFSVRSEELLARVKEIVHQGNIRRIIIKNEAGHTLIEIPLTLGVVGAVLAPVFVAVGAIAALAASYTLEVEKHEAKATAAPREHAGAGRH